MSDLFILQNQERLFLGKQREWLDGRDLAALYKTAHKDEAINQMVETTAKDFTQRITVVCVPANDKGLPDIDPALLPPPQPKPVRPRAESPELALDLTEPDAPAQPDTTDH